MMLMRTKGSALPPPPRATWTLADLAPLLGIIAQCLRLDERSPSVSRLTGKQRAKFLSMPTSAHELLVPMTIHGERAMLPSPRGETPLRPHPLGGSRPDGPRHRHTAACSVSRGA